MPPSNGDCWKKSYLHAGAAAAAARRRHGEAASGCSSSRTRSPLQPAARYCAGGCDVPGARARPTGQQWRQGAGRPGGRRPHLGRMTSTWCPWSCTARPRDVTTSPRPPTCGQRQRGSTAAVGWVAGGAAEPGGGSVGGAGLGAAQHSECRPPGARAHLADGCHLHGDVHHMERWLHQHCSKGEQECQGGRGAG